MIGITDQANDIIAALGQNLREAQGDLAVTSSNGYTHGFQPRSDERRSPHRRRE